MEWATASEINNSHFEAERSAFSGDWRTLGKVEGHGNSFQINQYQFIDERPIAGMNYYRLKQTDIDGKYKYSNVVRIDFNRGGKITISPNPVVDYLSFIFFKKTEEQLTVFVYDANGRLILNNPLISENKIDLINLTPGIYFIQIKNEIGGFILTDRFIKE